MRFRAALLLAFLFNHGARCWEDGLPNPRFFGRHTASLSEDSLDGAQHQSRDSDVIGSEQHVQLVLPVKNQYQSGVKGHKSVQQKWQPYPIWKNAETTTQGLEQTGSSEQSSSESISTESSSVGQDQVSESTSQHYGDLSTDVTSLKSVESADHDKHQSTHKPWSTGDLEITSIRQSSTTEDHSTLKPVDVSHHEPASTHNIVELSSTTQAQQSTFAQSSTHFPTTVHHQEPDVTPNLINHSTQGPITIRPNVQTHSPDKYPTVEIVQNPVHSTTQGAVHIGPVSTPQTSHTYAVYEDAEGSRPSTTLYMTSTTSKPQSTSDFQYHVQMTGHSHEKFDHPSHGPQSSTTEHIVGHHPEVSTPDPQSHVTQSSTESQHKETTQTQLAERSQQEHEKTHTDQSTTEHHVHRQDKESHETQHQETPQSHSVEHSPSRQEHEHIQTVQREEQSTTEHHSHHQERHESQHHETVQTLHGEHSHSHQEHEPIQTTQREQQSTTENHSHHHRHEQTEQSQSVEHGHKHQEHEQSQTAQGDQQSTTEHHSHHEEQKKEHESRQKETEQNQSAKPVPGNQEHEKIHTDQREVRSTTEHHLDHRHKDSQEPQESSTRLVPENQHTVSENKETNSRPLDSLNLQTTSEKQHSDEQVKPHPHPHHHHHHHHHHQTKDEPTTSGAPVYVVTSSHHSSSGGLHPHSQVDQKTERHEIVTPAQGVTTESTTKAEVHEVFQSTVVSKLCDRTPKPKEGPCTENPTTVKVQTPDLSLEQTLLQVPGGQKVVDPGQMKEGQKLELDYLEQVRRSLAQSDSDTSGPTPEEEQKTIGLVLVNPQRKQLGWHDEKRIRFDDQQKQIEYQLHQVAEPADKTSPVVDDEAHKHSFRDLHTTFIEEKEKTEPAADNDSDTPVVNIVTEISVQWSNTSDNSGKTMSKHDGESKDNIFSQAGKAITDYLTKPWQYVSKVFSQR